MDLIYPRCCGLDVHKRTVVACLFTPDAKGERHKEIRTFGTMTDDLLALADWLTQAGCTHVAMEATGAFGNRSTTSSKASSNCSSSTPIT